MSHEHLIYDTDKRFIIDSATRTIDVNKNNKPVLAQHDHNSEYVTFVMDRYVEGHDLAKCTRAEVHYNNFDIEERRASRGFYEATDLRVDPSDESKVIFTWIISDTATHFEGPLYFVVSFVCVEDDIIVYRWNTVSNSYFFVSGGICNLEFVEERYADVLEQWREDLFTLSGEEATNILVMAQNQLAAIEAKGATVMDNIPDDYASLEEDVFHSALYVTSELHLDDLNNAVPNRVYIFSLASDATVLNMPASDRHGVLITFQKKDMDGGHLQFFVTNNGLRMYFRVCWGVNHSWSAWKQVALNSDLTNLSNLAFQAAGFINSESVLADLDNAVPNRAYAISLSDTANVLNMPGDERHGSLLTFCRNVNDGTGGVQFFISTSGRFYTRICWGADAAWQSWKRFSYIGEPTSSGGPLDTINETPGLLSCFLNVGCIGDSLASGESVYTNEDGSRGYADLYKHSWGQYLARMTGNTYYNWSSGGRTCASWLTSKYATECFDGAHNCEAYIIGLGQNDYNQSYTIGASDNIDLTNYNNNSDSFYGNYGKIIQKIQEVQPKAKIFILTDPLETTETGGYNAAIREIATLFSNVYLVDLYTYGKSLYTSGIIASCNRHGHYNAIAYREMALIIATYIDWIMRKNISEFNTIELIDTDYIYKG